MLTYAWTSNNGGSFDDADALDTTWTARGATDADQTATLTLTVTDDGAGTRSASDTVTVTVKAQSQLAVTITADPTMVYGFGTVQLNATVTGASGAVTYSWRGLGTFSNDGIPNPVWTAHLASSNDVVTILELAVFADGVTAFAEVSITVYANQAPEVSVSADPTSVAGGGTVTLGRDGLRPRGGHADLRLDQQWRGLLRRRRRPGHDLDRARRHRRSPDDHAHAHGYRRRRGNTLRLRHGDGHRGGAGQRRAGVLRRRRHARGPGEHRRRRKRRGRRHRHRRR